MKTILLCSDLDRTLIPNGEEPESPKAREAFSRLSARPELCLTYVSGRNELLVREAIRKYDLPEPDFVIGDVGTTLYRIEKRKPGSRWCLDAGWQQEIGADWISCNRDDVVGLMAGVHGMDFRLQEEEKQNKFKVSYYTDADLEMEAVRKRISILLQAHGISSTVIWSRDDGARCGLLDILPPKANKLQAIRFLMKQEQIPEKNTVFAGDSGNDLDALTSGLQAILVKNSADDVRKAALEELGAREITECLYIAKGGLHGMNGNYAAGVLEGLVHFFPEAAAWIPVVGNY